MVLGVRPYPRRHRLVVDVEGDETMSAWEQFYAAHKTLGDCSNLFGALDCIDQGLPENEWCASCNEYERIWLDWRAVHATQEA